MRGETCLARAEHLQGPIPARQHARDVARHACTLFIWHVLPVLPVVQRPSECLRECQLASVSMLKISYVRTVQTLGPPLLVPK